MSFFIKFRVKIQGSRVVARIGALVGVGSISQVFARTQSADRTLKEEGSLESKQIDQVKAEMTKKDLHISALRANSNEGKKVRRTDLRAEELRIREDIDKCSSWKNHTGEFKREIANTEMRQAEADMELAAKIDAALTTLQ